MSRNTPQQAIEGLQKLNFDLIAKVQASERDLSAANKRIDELEGELEKAKSELNLTTYLACEEHAEKIVDYDTLKAENARLKESLRSIQREAWEAIQGGYKESDTFIATSERIFNYTKRGLKR